MISERRNDGIERSREQWFRRANSKHPERGGAPKSRTLHGHAWMEHARERWAELTNAPLARSGRDERVDHRSYERQGLDREPGQHFGPAAAYIVSRTETHDRLESAARVATDNDRLHAVERAIADLEKVRATWLREDLDPAEIRDKPGLLHAHARGDDVHPGR
jgi:MobA/MobL family